MTDKIVRPKELLIPPKTVLYNSNYEQKFYKYILTKNSKIQMRKFHLSKSGEAKAPRPPRRRDRCYRDVSCNLRMAVAVVRFMKLEKYNKIFFAT